ncbi:MAG: DUF6062 family protein [Anaerolineae bacterium]
MADEDTLYYELMDALRTGGCPLCHLGRRAASRYIETLNYEGVNDPGLRRYLRDAHGLCHRHAWEWTKLRGSPLGMAIVYRNLVKDLAETSQRQAEDRGRRPAAARLAPADRCPACRARDEAVQRYGRTLLKWLGREELAAAYASAGGLCLPHLRELLGIANDAQARTMLAWQGAIYRNLIAQLDEFIRKHDHRFQDEPFGVEKDAWLRAVAALAGEADVV